MNTNVNHLEPVEGSEDMWMNIPQHILVSEDWREVDVLTMKANTAGVLIANRSMRERERAQPGGGGSGERVGRDDQRGAQRTGLGEVGDVTTMQNVKTAVGKYDRAGQFRHACLQILWCKDFSLECWERQRRDRLAHGGRSGSAERLAEPVQILNRFKGLFEEAR